MWLSDEIAVTHPEAIVNGQEFAHIHPDGSLHAPLPLSVPWTLPKKGGANGIRGQINEMAGMGL